MSGEDFEREAHLARIPSDIADLRKQLRELEADADRNYAEVEHLGPHFQTGHWGGRAAAYGFIAMRVELMLGEDPETILMRTIERSKP